MRNQNLYRAGSWLPKDRKYLATWVNEQLKTIQTKNDALLLQTSPTYEHESVKALQDLIEQDADIYVLANQMIEEALEYSKEDPTGMPEITSYQTLLILIDHILSTAPEYTPPGSEGHGLIGFPINAILDWSMGTRAGYAFFLNEKVNTCFQNILNAWCDFLNTADSTYVLNTTSNGWMCPEAISELHIDEFVYDPNALHWGFQSWNDFFTRQFKDGLRPIADIYDPKVIISACESAPYRISTNVQLTDTFWLKSQPYSLKYMMNQDPYADKFVGGTVYQAFLSATKYHRWHSPVSGKIVKIYNVPGTYYSEIDSYPYDEAGPNNSQGYITQVATRAIIFIESDNPTIGLMCFIAVGMAEVSSCIITVFESQKVVKGDELGYFQFGGSTHCLIFQKDVIEQFVTEAIPASDFNNSAIIKVNSKLATTF